MKFERIASDPNSKARAGSITTDHGVVETPIFMPVGTAATVKGVHQRDLEQEINPRHYTRKHLSFVFKTSNRYYRKGRRIT